MRIGYVLKCFPKLSETFVLNEMVALERSGAEVSVFALGASGGAPLAPVLGDLNAVVHYLDSTSDVDLLAATALHQDEVQKVMAQRCSWLLQAVSQQRSPLKTLRRVVALAVKARTEGIEHLHAHFAGPAAELARLASGLLGIPYSFTCHAKDIYHETVQPKAFRRLADNAHAVITVCEANRDYILSELAPDIARKLHVLYNGVNLETFHPRNRQTDDTPLLLGVGRLVAKKGFIHLVEAVARLEAQGRTVRCVIAGEGRERTNLEAQIGELGVRGVELVGATRHSEVAALLERASVVVLPCVIDAEGNRDALPTVLLEAMAVGVPVVSTPVVGVGEIIVDGVTGALVPERDSKALADAIGLLLDAPKRGERMGRAGRQRAERLFDLHRNAEHLMAVLRQPQLQEAVA